MQITGFLPAGEDRGIAGLPIRLVISFVVGTAVLGVMLNMVSGVGALTTTELDARPTPDVVQTGAQTITVETVEPNGQPVSDVAVVLMPGTAGLESGGPVVARTDASGVATFEVTPTLTATHGQGTLEIAIKPPNGNYADRRGNTDILVVR
ncbi:DUF7382 domain-containing protein [Halarchaeum sp. P4]|uniref:DUF7382 domain-containing protein n=1 Tax=Halarchaeum sp. P4 TaxID=3421639 RepID=UPI003EB6AB9B